MRLLKTSTSGFSVQDPVNQPPRYAILSHRWGNNEPSLEEVQAKKFVVRDSEAGSEMKKALDACALAAQEGYGHMWIDTCCIDKKNSTELSAAINSMFRWYAESDICYVYLSDVPDDDPVERRHSRFRQSQWFTRGWTLQELLAPKKVHFYSSHWKFLGTRDALKNVISSITNIPVEVLAGGESRPPARSIGEILSWASTRKTLVEEDMAYSLLGLLDVNLPLLYGEGPRAFTRLQEELLKRHDDESIFAWEATPTDARAKPYFGLLSPSVEYFRDSHRFGHPRIQTRLHSEPIALTNKGIHIQLPLIKSDQGEDIFYALLDCHIEGTDDSEVQPAIKVQHLGGKQYARLDIHHLHDFNFARLHTSKPDTWGQSFDPCRQMIFHYHPQKPRPVVGFAVFLDIRFGNALRMKVLDFYPKDQWTNFAQNVVMLKIPHETVGHPEWRSPDLGEQNIVVGTLLVEVFDEDRGATVPGTKKAFAFGLLRPNNNRNTSTGGPTAWCRAIPGEPESAEQAALNARSRPLSELPTRFDCCLSEGKSSPLVATTELKQILSCVMYRVEFSGSRRKFSFSSPSVLI